MEKKREKNKERKRIFIFVDKNFQIIIVGRIREDPSTKQTPCDSSSHFLFPSPSPSPSPLALEYTKAHLFPDYYYSDIGLLEEAKSSGVGPFLFGSRENVRKKRIGY